MRFVWLTVEETHSRAPEVTERLVDTDEYRAKVEREGEKKGHRTIEEYGNEGILFGYNRKQCVHRSSDIERRSDHVLFFFWKLSQKTLNPPQLPQ